jgi:hypothetical protein
MMRLIITPFPELIKSGKAPVHGISFSGGMDLILPENSAVTHYTIFREPVPDINHNRNNYPGNSKEEDG